MTTDVKSDSGNTVDVDGNALTLYGSWEHCRFFVDSSLTYSLNDNESKRHIIGTTAKGDYDSEMLGEHVQEHSGTLVDYIQLRIALLSPRP